jgi:large subunit ribosomal protein L23
MNKYDVLLRPLQTEKTDVLKEQSNQYVFEVTNSANKRQIKEAVQGIFNVTVLDVHTMVMPGKSRRWGRHITKTARWKKAVVTVRPGDKIDLFE